MPFLSCLLQLNLLSSSLVLLLLQLRNVFSQTQFEKEMAELADQMHLERLFDPVTMDRINHDVERWAYEVGRTARPPTLEPLGGTGGTMHSVPLFPEVKQLQNPLQVQNPQIQNPVQPYVQNPQPQIPTHYQVGEHQFQYRNLFHPERPPVAQPHLQGASQQIRYDYEQEHIHQPHADHYRVQDHLSHPDAPKLYRAAPAPPKYGDESWKPLSWADIFGPTGRG